MHQFSCSRSIVNSKSRENTSREMWTRRRFVPTLASCWPLKRCPRTESSLVFYCSLPSVWCAWRKSRRTLYGLQGGLIYAYWPIILIVIIIHIYIEIYDYTLIFPIEMARLALISVIIAGIIFTAAALSCRSRSFRKFPPVRRLVRIAAAPPASMLWEPRTPIWKREKNSPPRTAPVS